MNDEFESDFALEEEEETSSQGFEILDTLAEVVAAVANKLPAKELLPKLELGNIKAEVQPVRPEAPFAAIKPIHDQLVQELEKKFGNDPVALAAVMDAVARLGPEMKRWQEQLQKDADVAHTGEFRKPMPAHLKTVIESAVSARYLHVMALMKLGQSPETIAAELKKDFDPRACALDTSGVLGQGFRTRADFAEGDSKSWYYKERHRGVVSPREAMEDKRPLDVWQGLLSNDTARNTAVFTVTRNGQRIESWSIQGTAADKTLKVAGLEGPDPKVADDALTKYRAEAFTAVLRSSLPADAQQEMLRDLTQMEARARAGDMRGHKGGVRAELAETYEQIARLLTDTKSGVRADYRIAVARQLARELGDPSDIDQGPSSDACRMVTVQYRLATMRPSVVARVTVEALLDGKVKIGKDKYLPLHPDNREPSSPQAMIFPRRSDERSFASQLFQVASMNLLGTNPEIIAHHIKYTNDWAKGLPKIHEPEGGITRLEFIQRKEQSDIRAGDVKNEHTRTKFDKDYRGDRRDGDPHPFLVNNGMNVMVHGRGNGPAGRALTADDRGATRKDGAHHLLMRANASQILLDMMDPEGNHKKCVLAYKGMEKYTGEQGLVRFETADQLADLVREAKRTGNLPLIIASRDYAMSASSRDRRGKEKEDFEESLADCDNTHIMIIKDIVDADPAKGIVEHLVTEDFFGKAYDRRILPRKEWGIYFANTGDTLPRRQEVAAEEEVPAQPIAPVRRLGIASLEELKERKKQQDIAAIRRLLQTTR